MTTEPAGVSATAHASNDFFDFSRADTRRSILLMALGAIAGLAIAGYGLFTAKGTSTNRLPPEDIALVNQRPIYRSDFAIQTQTQFSIPLEKATREQRQRVLDDMINEELVVQRALEVDLPAYDPEVRAALVNGAELQMYADVLAKQPTDAELRAYYEKYRDRYSSIGVMQLRDLMLNIRQDESPEQRAQRAQMVSDELRKGVPLDDAFMQKYGLRDSGLLMQSGKPDLGDIFDFAAEAKLGPHVYAATRKLEAGQVSGPITESDGLHIVVMNQRKSPRALDFQSVRPRVWTDLKNDEQAKIRNATLQYLRDKSEILTAEDF